MILAGIAAASPSPVGVPGAGIFTSPLILSLTIWVPVAVAISMHAFPNPRGRYDTLMKQIAFFTNLGILFVLFVAYNQFQSFLPTMQYEEKVPWLSSIGVTYHLGVDGPSMLMMMLSGLIGITAVLASWGVRERVRSYFSLLLLTQAAVNGAIVAHDMFVLVLFWGAVIIPVALLVLGWGGPRREAATWRLVGYWGIGTAALLIAIMAAYAATGGRSFDMDVLLKTSLAPRVQVAVAVALIIAAATRLPLFPLHGWVRDTYSEAPLGVSIVIAGTASRLGAYLLVRVLLTAGPDASKLLAPFVAGLAALTVIYAAIVALRSADLRWATAYLAMVPGGLTVMGLAALTPISIGGSVLSIFTGGLAAALIVAAAWTLTERAQTRSVQLLGGLGPRMPTMTWIFIVAALGLLGVPLLASFPAEAMIFFGSFKTQPAGAFAVVGGMVLTAVALAMLAHRVLFGPPNPDAPGVSDASLGETWYLALLAGGLIWVGLFPGGPKLPGTDQPVFDPGLVNIMSAGISDITAPFVPPLPPGAT
ncbi:MAG TPA: NADH-quinone oxidoreductase subunit M [Candidatus Dormibacteraeota bacterium]|jgi:NADH-quinone oxidoreductase subunit M|nr:NADH-quinone oxidoreductase subunit M [Candidatus Dormibacteraeota bacterium]